MKPENYDSMSETHKTRLAEGIMRSGRGRYLIGEALYRAAEAMSNDAQPAVSDIEDIEVLSRLFPIMVPDSRPMSEFSERAALKYQDESHR